ncbi:hypothetical protein EZS27_009375 [termite gut metagenome]|uniref:Uncharacterized protein n=1 Tax=termite gut metagenome TaxID=433724 RepID=A0A5J4SBT3_9ZZZZ
MSENEVKKFSIEDFPGLNKEQAGEIDIILNCLYKPYKSKEEQEKEEKEEERKEDRGKDKEVWKIKRGIEDILKESVINRYCKYIRKYELIEVKKTANQDGNGNINECIDVENLTEKGKKLVEEGGLSSIYDAFYYKEG